MKLWRKTLDHEAVKPLRYELTVEPDLCKGCRFCIEFCPRHVITESKDLNAKGYRPVVARPDAECLNCGLCDKVCPEFALKVVPVTESE